MARISGRFQRVAEAFDADVARVKLCESSGSEHSPESLTDLSDLVKSFMEKNEREGEGEDVGVVLQRDEDQEKGDEEEVEKSVTREMLQGLFAGNEVDDEDERDAKEKIRREVELACGLVGEYSLPGFKRRLMSRLREIGFDAGLCKSKWEKNGNLTAGDYEYIDVNFSGKRYIVEVSLSAEYEIGRPTNQYSSLLDVFPLIFVGKVEELKRVVRFMCTAIKCSMKRMDLHIPPWRRNGYMQAKWFGSYKRTTNVVATKKEPSHLSAESLFPKRLIGFEARLVKTLNCRDDYVSNTGFRIGYLTAVFNSDNFDMQL
ncbi:uncharacterized protein LOC133287239 [Gastrolobium bilobum]|uniref:uncharacterized protein LOC133287239 n=1 Tax=Gastrolobium bilobum TaxID=150636 RepID=UPI002AB017E1|nr:uncharacterized protein LOC133287239 [Gastrolobium bilobum]